MRVLSWNVNHRAARRQIPEWVPQAIAAHAPAVVVLTEYVQGPDHSRFITDLCRIGLKYSSVSQRVERQNQVLIATREPHDTGDLVPHSIHEAVPPNSLHVVLEQSDVNVLGFRVPAFEKERRKLKRQTWEWLLETAVRLSDRPAVITGDLNTAPDDPVSECGDCLVHLSRSGWHHARPVTGYSWVHPRWGRARQIDHTFVSPTLRVVRAEYNWDFRLLAPAISFPKAGQPDHAMLITDIRGA